MIVVIYEVKNSGRVSLAGHRIRLCCSRQGISFSFRMAISNTLGHSPMIFLHPQVLQSRDLLIQKLGLPRPRIRHLRSQIFFLFPWKEIMLRSILNRSTSWCLNFARLILLESHRLRVLITNLVSYLSISSSIDSRFGRHIKPCFHYLACLRQQLSICHI